MKGRILVVTHYFSPHGGGIELVAGQLSRRMGAKGWAVTWVASEPMPTDSNLDQPNSVRNVASDTQFVGMKTFNFLERWLGIPYPLWSLRSLLRLRAQLKVCEAVHLHDAIYLGNLLAFAFAKWSGRPVIVTQHIGDIPYRNWFLRQLVRLVNRWVAGWVLSRADAVVFISEKVRDYFERFVRFRGRVLLIPNGVDSNFFHPASDVERRELRKQLGWSGQQLQLVFVGRFVEKKGLHIIRQLAAAMPQTNWTLVGAGPLDPSSWNLENVQCLGTQSQFELLRIYQSADRLVLPSVGEGFPLVVQEAMSCGLPVLVSRQVAESLPKVLELVQSCEPTFQAFRAALSKFGQPNEEAKESSHALVQHARSHWSWDSCTEQYSEMLDEVVAEWPADGDRQIESVRVCE